MGSIVCTQLTLYIWAQLYLERVGAGLQASTRCTSICTST